jgi:excisionase family DNA binding protein
MERVAANDKKTPTAALFVRVPAEQARRLDRAAFELGRSKQSLVSELLERYIDPGPGLGFPQGGRRRVTVETLEPDTLVVGHHSFRPDEPAPRPVAEPEVLRSEQAGELLQLEPDVVERLAAAGELPGRMLAGEWRFSRTALLTWLAQPGAECADGDDR